MQHVGSLVPSQGIKRTPPALEAVLTIEEPAKAPTCTI